MEGGIDTFLYKKNSLPMTAVSIILFFFFCATVLPVSKDLETFRRNKIFENCEAFLYVIASLYKFVCTDLVIL